MRLLLLSTPVGPLGSGLGGGIELTVANLAMALEKNGHQVTVVTPAGADLAAVGLADSQVEVVQIPGSVQKTAQTQSRSAPVITSAALANAWDYARQVQLQYDLLVNFAYDWLPFYLTPFLDRPVAHFVSMGSLSDVMDAAIAQTSTQFPGTLGAYTPSQTETFGHLIPPADWRVLGCGLDLDRYEYCSRPGNFLAWAGRISPEKGLEAAIAAAIAASKPLKIFGKIEDANYWQALQLDIESATSRFNRPGLSGPAHLAPSHFTPSQSTPSQSTPSQSTPSQSTPSQSTPSQSTPSQSIEYCGFLPTDELQKAIGQARALLVTPHWIEAFGIVAIEALACGVPVIAYSQGGPAEIVQSGKTGFLVEPNDVDGLVQAIAKIDDINRANCRSQAEKFYALPTWGRRFEQWFNQIVSSASRLSA